MDLFKTFKPEFCFWKIVKGGQNLLNILLKLKWKSKKYHCIT